MKSRGQGERVWVRSDERRLCVAWCLCGYEELHRITEAEAVVRPPLITQRILENQANLGAKGVEAWRPSIVPSFSSVYVRRPMTARLGGMAPAAPHAKGSAGFS